MTQRHRCLATFLIGACLLSNKLARADEFSRVVAPFAAKYCTKCHQAKKARGELDLTRYKTNRDVVADFRRWGHVVEFIRRAEMPPAEAPQPTPTERSKLLAAIEAVLLTEARKHAGDPGVVLPRRLSNTEYDHSIRDLTGFDIRPTREFPVDPAGGEGFDNTGEALAMSPSLLKKYLTAAQHVSNHLVLTTRGIEFAPFPVTSYNERRKLTEQAIIDFYQRHRVNRHAYLVAAWEWKGRRKREPNLTIQQFATNRKLSAKYLALVFTTLEDARKGSGYLYRLSQLWNALPLWRPGATTPADLHAVEAYIKVCQRELGVPLQGLIRSNAGNWPISHLDFRSKTAARRDQLNKAAIGDSHVFRMEQLGNKRAGELTFRLRLQPSTAQTKRGTQVVFKRPFFSSRAKRPRNKNEERQGQVRTLREVLKEHDEEQAKQLRFGQHPSGRPLDADSFVVSVPAVVDLTLPASAVQDAGRYLHLECALGTNAGEDVVIQLQHSVGWDNKPRKPSETHYLVRANSEATKLFVVSAEKICHTFPNRFFYVDSKRGLAAGFHLVEGFFRDDEPLMEKVLDQNQQRELNRLWSELHFMTQSVEVLIRGFVWFERSERHVLHDKRFDFLRPEDPKLVETQMLNRFERLYMDRMGVKLEKERMKPLKPSDKFDMIHGFFDQIRSGLAERKRREAIAEKRGMQQLLDLARRAYGRDLGKVEADRLRSLYAKLRKQGQSVEASYRGLLIAVLMSPEFCYQFVDAPPGSKIHPLSNHALAERLSYFLWSSLPDEELLATAKKGQLQNEQTIESQTRRMLKSDKMEAFAREFFGQWLRYRDYLSKDSINGDSFPGYDDELRQAMFDEPVKLASHLIRNDLPITDLLGGNVTFVNARLAKHYGGDIAKQYQQRRRAQPTAGDAQWLKVEGLRRAGRGGLFGMAIVLTSNSSGARTSPVKRGFWTVHHLLGQHFPPPPADVPELPPNEKEAKRTIRQLITEHTANPQCAMCHKHFDSLGMALEGFDPIGRRRTKDLAGRTVDDVATLPNGKNAKGINGLIEYIEQHRKKDFVRTLCRKFLGYALGRSVVLSDQPLLREMESALEKNDYRFSVLFETVVKSRQFRSQRGRDFVAIDR